MSETDYKLTIIPRSIGGYEARLESSEGDLWTRLDQDPQEGEQFKDSLVVFVERFGTRWKSGISPSHNSPSMMRSMSRRN